MDPTVVIILLFKFVWLDWMVWEIEMFNFHLNLPLLQVEDNKHTTETETTAFFDLLWWRGCTGRTSLPTWRRWLISWSATASLPMDLSSPGLSSTISSLSLSLSHTHHFDSNVFVKFSTTIFKWVLRFVLKIWTFSDPFWQIPKKLNKNELGVDFVCWFAGQRGNVQGKTALPGSHGKCLCIYIQWVVIIISVCRNK